MYLNKKKSWHQAVTNLHAENKDKYPINKLCILLGVSKQAYYKREENVILQRLAQEEFALSYIYDIRKKDAGIGGKKIWQM